MDNPINEDIPVITVTTESTETSAEKRAREFGFSNGNYKYVNSVAAKVAKIIAENAATYDDVDNIFNRAKELVVITGALYSTDE